jgi:hypothetical protein
LFQELVAVEKSPVAIGFSSDEHLADPY